MKRFTKDTLSSMGSREFWLSLNPGMSITDYPYLKQPPKLSTETAGKLNHVRQMKTEGYFKLDGVLPEDNIKSMADAVIRLVDEGFPPIFAYVYDEFWQIFRNISPLVTPIFGDHYRLSTNRWAWHIPPSGEDAGFAPHRDMVGCPEPVMRKDGLPWIATVWIPLHDVDSTNACMHVLPTNKDDNVPDNMTCTDIPQESIQNIHALPCKAGSILSWNPNVLHWGSRSSEWASEPRISIATYLLAADGPNFTSVGIESTQPMSLGFRVAVIGRAISHYDSDIISDENYSPQLMKFCEPYHFCEPDTGLQNQTVSSDLPGTPNTGGNSKPKIGRNQPCPCGSGKKYKYCHGR